MSSGYVSAVDVAAIDAQYDAVKQLLVEGFGHEWRQYAACKGMPLNLFFDENKSSTRNDPRELCASCPVSAECLAAAVRDLGSRSAGIFGGVGAAARSRLRVRLRRDGVKVPEKPDWDAMLNPTEIVHGTHYALKRHYLDKTPMCELCVAFSEELRADRKRFRAAMERLSVDSVEEPN